MKHRRTCWVLLAAAADISRPPAAAPLAAQECLDSPIDRRSDFYRQQALLQQFQRVRQLHGSGCKGASPDCLLACCCFLRDSCVSKQHAAWLTTRPLQGKLKPQPLWTPPNVCTFARVALVPVFVLLWHTTHDYASVATASVFITAALTDWLDGYLARRVSSSKQGKLSILKKSRNSVASRLAAVQLCWNQALPRRLPGVPSACCWGQGCRSHAPPPLLPPCASHLHRLRCSH
jgi:hypothetical protein